MRAAIADLTPTERRGFGYGILNTALGDGWGLGGAVMALVYELSINYVILFTVVMELISIILFFHGKKSKLAYRRSETWQ